MNGSRCPRRLGYAPGDRVQRLDGTIGFVACITDCSRLFVAWLDGTAQLVEPVIVERWD